MNRDVFPVALDPRFKNPEYASVIPDFLAAIRRSGVGKLHRLGCGPWPAQRLTLLIAAKHLCQLLTQL
jgi:hypothetical protein